MKKILLAVAITSLLLIIPPSSFAAWDGSTNFPGSLDTSTQLYDVEDDDTIADEHHDALAQAIIAVETKLGTGDSTAVLGGLLIGTGDGASAWDTTPTLVDDFTLDKGSANSPKAIFIDGDDNTLQIYKSDGGSAFIDNDEGGIGLRPSGDTTNYLFFRTVTGVPEIDTGSSTALMISAAGGAINIRPNGDDDNYLQAITSTNVPGLFSYGANMIFGGTGQTNNESLTWDYETTENQVGVSSGTGVTKISFASIDLSTDHGTLVPGGSLGTISNKTIASGVVDGSGGENFIALAGQGGVADDLTEIQAKAVGDVVILKRQSVAYTITVKDGTYLLLQGDFALDDNGDTITLICISVGANDTFAEVHRSSAG